MQELTKPTVAFLGPKASYTHQVSRFQHEDPQELHRAEGIYPPTTFGRVKEATLSKFPENHYDIEPKQSIEDVFAAVQGGSADFGIVPFENSSNGSVVFTLDLFADIYGKHPDILVDGEIYLPVHHCLVGYPATTPPDSGKDVPQSSKLDQPWRQMENLNITDTDSPNISGTVTPTQQTPSPGIAKVKPTHDISHITKLYSHPQAWGQCKLFLNTYLKGIERQDVSSTSKAAQLAAEDPSGTVAAVSSQIAAATNNLTVLAANIEDASGNATRFFILRHRTKCLLPTTAYPYVEEEASEMPRFKSLVSFTVKHEHNPGSLAASLAVFRKWGLNLTSLHSRPSGLGPWRYLFFVEVMGQKREDGCGGAVNGALEELGEVAEGWRFLGSWENELA